MKKKLAELGFRFSGEELLDTDAIAFTIIAGEISKIDSENAKRRSNKMRSRRG